MGLFKIIMAKYFTPEGLKKIKKELMELKQKRKEIAERLKYTASFGDLTENFAYQQAKEDQAFVEGRILELEEILSQAKIIKKEKHNKVQLGSKVTVIFDHKKEKFLIVEAEEANLKEGKISNCSPLGQALLGKLVGEKIKIQTPQGEKIVKIVKIE